MAFADFTEHEQAIGLLQRSLERGRLGHAYLLIGPSPLRLEALARTFAKVINCEASRKSAPSKVALDSCDRCAPCRRIEQELHPDVQWVRPESKSRVITVDQVRELLQFIHLKPGEARYKVGVIVAADRLNVSAGNAFLKTLEEPPANSLLILLTTEPQQVLETIRSRCLRLSIGGEEIQSLYPGSMEFVKRFGELAVARDRSLLSRYRTVALIAAELGRLREKIEAELSARSPVERYGDLEPEMRKRLEGELSAAIEAEYRRQRSELMRSLQWWFRDVWLAALGIVPGRPSYPELASETRSLGERLSPQRALENLDILECTQRLLSTNVQEALALEVSMLKLQL